MQKIHTIAFPLFLTLALLGAGCSKQGTNSVSSVTPAQVPSAETTVTSNVSACDVFTPELAKKFLGEVGEPTENTGPIVTNCTYSSAQGGITLLIKHSSQSEQDGAIEASKGLSGVDPVMVDGLGDKAYWAGGKLNQINVYKGNDWYIISAFMSGFDKDKAIEIVREVLKNS
ncbi:MAG: hypothetical protein RDU25_03040 [Patescibacteria group bacterium]|nr:hypothetical protein [Patescibacteria group bacterium]